MVMENRASPNGLVVSMYGSWRERSPTPQCRSLQGVGGVEYATCHAVQPPDQDYVQLALGRVVQEPPPGGAGAQVGRRSPVGVLAHVGPILGGAEVEEG